MKVNIFVISSLVGVLGMITHTQSFPMEVVYTGDSCDCPRNLNYMVNVPPPPKTNEYKTSEYGYKVDVPIQGQAKAKVTYSFDFTVQEPKIPPPTEQEKWNLYAKIDRITAHKKDCYASESSSSSSSNTCGCSNSNRYVSPEAIRNIRNIRKFSHPNSISKNDRSTRKLLAIFLPPLDRTQNIVMKSRNKRDISRIFSGFKNNNNVKRQERLVKKYNKRLQSRPEIPTLFSKTPSLPSKTAAPINSRPFETLKNFLVPPRLRNKRDIKGEYDLIEKEREQLDLTLPEIIQFMPETLNPDFKRGQCQFSHLCELQEPMAQIPAIESITATNDNAKETLANMENESQDSTGKSENAISSTLKKRNAADYGCGLNVNGYHTQQAIPTYNSGYSFQANAPATVNPHYDYRPRPFSVTGSSYGIDPPPQQYVGATYSEIAQPPIINNEPIVGAVYSPHGQHTTNAQLDQIITDIVNRHSDFIDASTHPGGSLVDATSDQEYQTKSMLKNLWDGHWQKLFADEPLDNSYSYMPYYQTRAPAPAFAPRQY